MNKQFKAYRQQVSRIDREEIRELVQASANRLKVRPRRLLRMYRKERRRNRPGKATVVLEIIGKERAIDPDRLREILQIIFDFLKMLLTLFALI